VQKHLFNFIALLFFACTLSGQSAVLVSDATLKVNASGGEEIFYYGFAEGDKMIFHFEEVNGKELKEIEISEYGGSSKFMDYKTNEIEKHVINVTRTAIYKFRLTNSAPNARVCHVKIQRIPANKATKNFNTSVFWRTVQDTLYTLKNEQYLAKSDTFAQEIYAACPQLSSKLAINGNKNRQVVDFTLPKNTISWSFYIGTGSEAQVEYERAQHDFAKNAAIALVKMPGYGPMAALAISGVSYFNHVQGEDNVKYWLLSNSESVAAFEAGQSTFQDYKKGDVITEASQMKTPLEGKVHLGILNDNTIDPIRVTIKATAIVVEQDWQTRTVQEMQLVSKQEPYLK
jgi:hypothetical protein